LFETRKVEKWQPACSLFSFQKYLEGVDYNRRRLKKGALRSKGLGIQVFSGQIAVINKANVWVLQRVHNRREFDQFVGNL
jgi:hypothetical protein